jgi:hypothetical protein
MQMVHAGFQKQEGSADWSSAKRSFFIGKQN